MKRGDIWTVSGSGYAGKPRPSVIVQNDRFDTTSSITLVPCSSIDPGPTSVRIALLPSEENGLRDPTWLMADKITSLHRDKLGKRIGVVSPEAMDELDAAMLQFLGLVE